MILYEMIFTSDNFTALCDKHRLTGVLVKIWGNRCSLLQVEFLMAVNLFVHRPSHKPFLRPMEKNSGESSLILRLKRMEYDMLPKICLCENYFFLLPQNNRHNLVCQALSKCNLLYRSIVITLQDIQKYPVVDTTGYLNPQILMVKGVFCMHMHKQTKSSK